MSFHVSAEEIRVDDGHMLRARLNNGEDFIDAEMNLNDCIGNNNGIFEWGGAGFADSAEEISFAIEGDGVPILRAKLRNMDGELCDADINLAERIENRNGYFCFA